MEEEDGGCVGDEVNLRSGGGRGGRGGERGGVSHDARMGYVRKGGRIPSYHPGWISRSLPHRAKKGGDRTRYINASIVGGKKKNIIL
jgi:hypothetical protein